MTYITKDRLAAWGEAATIRACKTAAQVGILMLGGETFTAFEVDWYYIAGFMIGGFILSMLTSVAGIPEVEGGADLPTIYASGEGKHARGQERNWNRELQKDRDNDVS